MKALVVSGGEEPSLKNLVKYVNESDIVIGVDKGCKYLYENNIVPDLVVGDFDSSNIDIINKLESKELLQGIEEDDDNNIKVYIGNENNIDSDVTVIKTKFKQGDEEGTIAIIGPKRMEYDRVVGLLEYMKDNIER